MALQAKPSVLVLHNLPREHPAAAGDWAESDAGVLAEVGAVSKALSERGYAVRVAGVRRLEDIPVALSSGTESIIFNLVEELVTGPADAYQVPTLCHAAGRESTGNSSRCQLLCMDKYLTKAALAVHGVASPPAVLVREAGVVDLSPLPAGRVIVKPAAADASEGIDAGCVRDRDDPAVPQVVERVRHSVGGGAILVEAFVDGREVNATVIECDGTPAVLPPAEIEFVNYGPGRPRIVDYAAKWRTGTSEYVDTVRRVPADLPVDVVAAVKRAALAAWKATGCRDYARVDFRLDAAGVPLVLEVNPNPDICPLAGVTAALEAAGVPYADFVEAMVVNATRRLQQRAPAPPAALTCADGVEVRRTQPADRDAILGFIRDTGMFRDNEMETADEVLSDALRQGPSGHYQSFTAIRDGRPAGWVCLGPTPCTIGTYDIYWIVVAPALQRAGVGRSLMASAEDFIAGRGGHLVVVETSGRPDYDATRRFYTRCGYGMDAQIPHFYAPGDPKQVLTKVVSR